MLSDREKRTLATVIKATYEKHLLKLKYCDQGVTDRVIEPYCITGTESETMIRAYQLSPETGWRFFKPEFIVEIKETGKTFVPRRPAMIRTGADVKHISPVESEDREAREYEKLVLGALADMKIDADDKQQLSSFRAKFGLTLDEIRGVHYRIFCDCLNSITADRLVTEDERRTLLELNSCLHECGAGMIE